MKPKDAPHYIPGTIVISVCIGAECVVILAWKFWLMYMNRKKQRAIEAEGLSPEEVERQAQALGAQDVTDLKNPYFMWVASLLCARSIVDGDPTGTPCSYVVKWIVRSARR